LPSSRGPLPNPTGNLTEKAGFAPAFSYADSGRCRQAENHQGQEPGSWQHDRIEE